MDNLPIAGDFPEFLDAFIDLSSNGKSMKCTKAIPKQADKLADTPLGEYIAVACAEGYLRLVFE